MHNRLPLLYCISATALCVAAILLFSSLYDFRSAHHDVHLPTSYGLGANGFCGLFDTTAALGLAPQRSHVPPHLLFTNGAVATVLLLHPRAVWDELAPNTLRDAMLALGRGSSLVVTLPEAPACGQGVAFDQQCAPTDASFFLEQLGLGSLTVNRLPAPRSSQFDSVALNLGSAATPLRVGSAAGDGLASARLAPVVAQGAFSEPTKDIHFLTIPDEGMQVLTVDEDVDFGNATLTGALGIIGPDGSLHRVGASFAVGQGELVIISDARLFSNGFLSKRDNAALAVMLSTPSPGAALYFDTFFHGNSAGRSPVDFFLEPPFHFTLLSIVLLLLICIWRVAIRLGPSLRHSLLHRRCITEYIDAVSLLYLRGKCTVYLLQTITEGVLWMWRRRLHLKGQQQDSALIIQALHRKNPRQAAALRHALEHVDQLLQHPKMLGKPAMVAAAREIVSCLYSNSMTR